MFPSFNPIESSTPDAVKRQRAIAEALIGRSATPAANWSHGLADVAAAISGTVLNNRSAEAEQAGRASVADALAGLGPQSSFSDIANATSNPWVTDSPGASAIASALLGNNLKQADPLYQAQLADAQTPDAQSLINTANGIYDPNNGSWIQPPSVGMAGAPPPNVKGEGDLRGEYNGINTVKDFGLQTQAYQRVLDSSRDPSPAGDLALIFNFMKVLDPGSTVREGEFATAQNSGSVPEQLVAQYNKIVSGERLVPEIRKDFVDRAGQLYEGAAQLQQGTNDRYSGLAQQYGYDPSRIVAPVPQIGVLDPEFNPAEYVSPSGEQIKPIPLTPTNADAEYNALPSGAIFIDPDGNQRKKP